MNIDIEELYKISRCRCERDEQIVDYLFPHFKNLEAQVADLEKQLEEALDYQKQILKKYKQLKAQLNQGEIVASCEKCAFWVVETSGNMMCNYTGCDSFTDKCYTKKDDFCSKFMTKEQYYKKYILNISEVTITKENR